jgi:hypothetical protein
MSVYQQNVLRAAADQFVVMGKAWVCWDPRHAVVVAEKPEARSQKPEGGNQK